MKNIFTKIYPALVSLLIVISAALPANAQDTKNDLVDNVGASAMCRDAAGNVYVIRGVSAFVDETQGTDELVEYPIAGGSPVVLNSNVGLNQGTQGGFTSPTGLAIASNGDIYMTAYDDGVSNGDVMKLTKASNYATKTTFYAAYSSTYGNFYGLAMDSHDNLYVTGYDTNGNGGNGTFDIFKFSSVSSAGGTYSGNPAIVNSHIGDNEQTGFAANNHAEYVPINAIAIDGSDNIFVSEPYAFLGTAGYDGGSLVKLSAISAGNYGSSNTTPTLLKSSFYGSALGFDPSGNLYATVITAPGTSMLVYQLENLGLDGANASSPTPVYTGLGGGVEVEPWGIAAISSTDIYITNGEVSGSGQQGDIYQLFGTPTTQASGISSSSITETAATLSWTNGSGTSRAVFVALTTAGSIAPSNGTSYAASTTFTSGGQAGAGWYCVYNGSGSTNSVSISNLTATKSYKVMVIEYNGGSGTQNYNTNTATNNPNTFTALANPSLTASGGTDSYTTGGAAVVVDAGITATAGQTNLSTATISVSSNFSSGDVLNFTSQNGITGSFSGSTLTLSGSATVANYQTALRSITFSSSAASSATRTISFLVGDGTANSGTVTKNITVTVATTISSLTAVSGTTTNAASVQFTATFAASVSGLSTSDFSLTTSGVSGASVTGVSGSGTSWTITVNTGSGDGSVQLVMNSSSGVSPSVSNIPFNGATYTIDKTAPVTSSITATTPSNASPTNATSVTYTVTFSESVTGVDATDFTLTTSGTSGSVSGVSGSGTTYTVTVSSISGSGTLRLDLKSSGTGITDGVGNAISGGFTTGGVYTIDQTAPTVSSITATTPSNASTTNASSVTYTVTFSEGVTGVDNADFTFTSGGASPGGVSVTPVSSSVYTVVVSSISGNGTLRLDLKSSGTGIADLTGNAISGGFTGGDIYTFDHTAPTTTSITATTPSNASPTNASSVTYTVTFSEAVAGVDAADFTLTTSGTSGSVSGVSGSGATYTVTVSSITGSGTLRLDLNSSGTGITDVAGNAISGGFTGGDTYNIDNTAPTAVSLAEQDGSTTTNQTQLDYTLTTSEAVTGVDASDFTVVTTGGITHDPISITPISANTYNITITNVAGNGTLQLNLNSSGTGIADLAGNPISGGINGDTFTVDQTAPTVQSITATTPANTNPTNATSVAYTVTFSEAVTGVDASDFTATTSGVSSTGIVVTPVSSSVYTVTVSGISGDGTLRLDLNNSNTGIFDAAFNQVSGGFTSGDVYNIDNTAPTLTSLVYSSSNSNAGFAKTGDVITLAFGANEAIQTPAVTIAGHTITATNTGGNNYSASYTMTGGDTEGRIPFNLTVTDLAGNSGNETDIAAGDDIEFDMTAPTAVISAPSVASVSNNGSGTASYTVTYADANFNTSALTTGGITLNTTGTATGTVGVSGSGTSYTVTISSITGVGTLGISVAGGNASDNAGNTDAGAGPSGTFNVLNSDATLSALSLSHGTLAPAFDPGTISYTANEFNGTQTITVTAVTADPNATILINGTIPATSGVATGPITLAVGSNTIDIAVTAQDGLTSKTYTVTVTRAPSSNDDLSGLTMDHGVLSPSFTKANTSYTASVTNSVSSIEVKAALTDATAVLKIDGQVVASQVFSQAIPLNVGPNTVTVTIKAQNNVSVKTYTIVVTRAPSANDKLALLQVSKGIFGPAFTSTNTSYTDAVGNTISSVTVTPTAADPTATIQVNGTTVTSGTASGPVNVPFGSSTINVTVTAQDGTTSQTYAIAVTRPANNDADLSFLHMSMGRFGWPFDRNITSYADTVGNDKTTIKVIPTTLDTGARVTVNGIPVISGTESAPVSLVFGNNTILVKVTAEDGTTTKTYTVTVLRPVYDRDNLTALKVSNGIFSPAFDSGTTSYTDNVGNSISSITVTPTVGNPTATIKVNGLPVSSGTASGAISLAVGTTTINVVVKAQDSIATKTYTITVTRAPGSTDSYQDISVTKPTETPALAEDGIQVHQGISPNGDGLNDFLTIDNISQYPDNKLTIMNRNGQMIYEAKGYDNASKTFDGHSNKNGQMQLPGTYFYQLDYTVNGIIKHKTGFIVLKY